MSSSKLYVGNLPDVAKEKDLRELFEAFGQVGEVAVLGGFGFVHFEKTEDATAALNALDDSEFMGSHIQVQISRTKGHGYGRGSGPPRPRRGTRGGFRESPYGGGGGDRSYDRHGGGYERHSDYDRYHYEYRDHYDYDYPYDRYDYGRYAADFNGRSRSPVRSYYGAREPAARMYYDKDPFHSDGYRDSYASRSSYSRRW